MKHKFISLTTHAGIHGVRPTYIKVRFSVPCVRRRLVPVSLLHVCIISHVCVSAGGPLSPPPAQWGAPTAEERGPVLATNTNEGLRNVIGAHSGSYCIYRALAVASGALDPVCVTRCSLPLCVPVVPRRSLLAPAFGS